MRHNSKNYWAILLHFFSLQIRVFEHSCNFEIYFNQIFSAKNLAWWAHHHDWLFQIQVLSSLNSMEVKIFFLNLDDSIKFSLNFDFLNLSFSVHLIVLDAFQVLLNLFHWTHLATIFLPFRLLKSFYFPQNFPRMEWLVLLYWPILKKWLLRYFLRLHLYHCCFKKEQLYICIQNYQDLAIYHYQWKYLLSKLEILLWWYAKLMHWPDSNCQALVHCQKLWQSHQL